MLKWLRDFIYPEAPVKTQTTVPTNVTKAPARKTTTRAKKTTKTTKTSTKKVR